MSSVVLKSGTKAEHELLLWCAGTSTSPAAIERIRALATRDIDWNYLVLLARRHAVFPLLYRQLSNNARDLVPDECLCSLKKQYQENAARNVVLTAELSRIIKLLGESGVEAIPYKGPLLALFAYDDLSMRRFVDLDIMVRKSDVLKAQQLLITAGYKPAKSLSAGQQQVLLRTQHNMQFTRDGGKFIVELHWEVASHLFASSVTSDELWSNLISTQLNGVEIRALSSDDLLFSLCVHGSRHLWERLSWISDIAQLISRHKIDWRDLLERTVKNDSERIFLLGLKLARDLLNATLPATIDELVAADDYLNRLAANVSRRLFTGNEHVPATSREIFRYNIAVRKSWRARARYCVFMLRPTDSDLTTVALPRRLGFAYYLMRPFRLLSKD